MADTPSQLGGLTQARVDALKLARTGATNEQILAALRATYCAGQPGGPASLLQKPDLERSFGRWVDSGVIDDSRIAGELAVLASLQDVAETDAGKDGVSAATTLLRHRAADVPAQLRQLMRKLRDMTDLERAQHLREHAEKLT